MERKSGSRCFQVASLFLLFLTALVAAKGQNPDRPRTFDVKHYAIHISFDRDKKIVYGDTTVELTPLSAPLNSVDLDAIGLKFSKVTMSPRESPLTYRTSDGQIAITLDRSYSSGENISLRFNYSITDPKKGVYFIDAERSANKFQHPAQIWTQNEPEDGRYWFPSFDFPSDKATSEEFITVQKGEVAVGNGRLIDNVQNADGTVTYHYRMNVPHSTYLTSFVVGDFIKLSDKYKDIPLGFYAYADRRRVAGIAFSRTKEMMEDFEALTGISFPFEKYDQAMVAGFQDFDGMENVTATTLADTSVLFAEYPFGKPIVENLVSHELAHSWFGDMVTCKNWSELWLNEGFATFMEAAFREKAYGRANYIQTLIQDRDEFITDDAVSKNRHPLRNLSAKADNSLFDVTTYQKGGVVLHMLRETVGDAAFWKGVNIYLSRHKFDNVVSSDLQSAMEEASGQKLQWFFDQWVYAAGYPKLEVTWTNDPAPGGLKITVNQAQKSDGMTPAAFQFPLDVTLLTESGPVLQTLKITKRVESFTINEARPVKSIEIDKSEKILLKSVKIK